jgi:flagellar operon protein
MKISDLQFSGRVQPLQPLKPPTAPKEDTASNSQAKNVNFGDLLQNNIEEQQKVRFSNHAIKRLQERSLILSQDLLERLNSGVQQLDEKGARNSLVLIDQTAYVVSVKNKTVVTAVNQSEEGKNIFTNIDGVAIV